MSHGSLEIETAPILGASLNPGAWCPGQTALVDVFARGGGRLVTVVDEHVEAESSRGTGLTGGQGEGDGRLDAVAVGGSVRDIPESGGGSFDETLAGVGVAGRADLAGRVEGEDAHLETPGGVLGAGLGVDADFHGIAAPMAFDVVRFDVGDHDVVEDPDVDEQFPAGVQDADLGGAIGRAVGLALPDLVRADVEPCGFGPRRRLAIERRRAADSGNAPVGHRVQAGGGDFGTTVGCGDANLAVLPGIGGGG